MSTARHHADWLRLVEVSGPFLSMPVLLRAFPQGLDARDDVSELRLRLSAALEEWLDDQQGRAPDAAIHDAWIRFVLKEVLQLDPAWLVEGQSLPAGCTVAVPEHQDRLAPTWALVDPPGRPTAGQARLFVSRVPHGQSLDGAQAGARWKASPATRMMALLHGAQSAGVGARIGLVTNGEHWMLVHAVAGETTTYLSFYASLWLEEPVSLRAFQSLLGSRRFFEVEDGDTLEALFRESAAHQHEVTDQLGAQVRRAVEVLIQTIDRIDRDRGRELLRGTDEKALYEAAVTVMMRLVFLLSAEERGLLLLGDPLYDQHYAVSTLRDQLQEVADHQGTEVLSRRHDAWSRLLATFRAVHGGVRHESMRLPAYGGSLFDPERYPFLEGRAPHPDPLPGGEREPGPKLRAPHPDPLPASRGEGAASPSAPHPAADVATPLSIDNLTVLDILSSLQVLQVKLPGGGGYEPRRLSFRALDVEQIGHVYEGLLDHTAKRAKAPVVSLRGTKGLEPEIALDELETVRSKGEEALLDYLAERTGRGRPALAKGLAYQLPKDDHARRRYLIACDNRPAFYERVAPWAGLVRDDVHGRPVVFDEGAVYVTEGVERRATGTHYTPRSLTEPIVLHTLEPLVYEGPADGWPKERWTLRSPRALLALRVCDLAMGSGAFLVQACRYLSERLVEAWETAEQAAGGRLVVTPEGDLSTGSPTERPLPRDADERLAIARRIVVDRCLYGVDKNPMAVEMAKLSLWLVTLQKDRPFTFVDHALRCGDSLLGLTSPEQIEHFHLDPARGKRIHATQQSWTKAFGPALRRALELRQKLESFPVETVKDAEEKARLLAEAESALSDARLLADLVIGAAMSTATRGESAFDDALLGLSRDADAALQMDPVQPFDDGPAARALLRANGTGKPPTVRAEPAERSEAESKHESRRAGLERTARSLLNAGRQLHHAERRTFHWVLEFPEVFAGDSPPLPSGERAGVRGGFDAFVGNPPFMGGQRITGAYGTDYRDLLVEHVGGGARGSADLCAYFFLRCGDLLADHGMMGLLATNTIAQGDTREVGLDQMVAIGFSIPRAVPSRPWPGEANLEVAHVWVRRGHWGAQHVLDDKPVRVIGPQLVVPGRAEGKPYRLAANAGKSFQGSNVLGLGFTMTPEGAVALIRQDERNRDVLFPYLNGDDLNSRPDQSASRWVINFRDWPLDRASAPQGFNGPVAADYPDCLAIVREKVKPERDRMAAGDATARDRARRWWQFARPTTVLYAAIAHIPRVLVRARVANLHSLARLPHGPVFNEQTVVFASDGCSHFTVLQSGAHIIWLEVHSSSMRADVRYTPTDCFETFPFPPTLDGLDDIGNRYDAHRRSIMLARQEGLTKTYNRFHNPTETSDDIATLRRLHVEMDQSVARAYGWTDLDLGHGFHETKQGLRYTLSEPARREILDRLLELNHARYAEEVAQGLHDDKKKGAKRGKPAVTVSAAQTGFGFPEVDGDGGASTAKPKRGKR